MHGEYKTPNGKLIAVDFRVIDDRLRDVMVSGDFFIYPDEAFSHLADSIEGTPVDRSINEIAAQVQLALPKGTELLGSSPDALATAVRRALDGEAMGGDGGEA